MSDQYNPLVIRYLPSMHGYSYDNQLYHEKFPEEWATSHLPDTGPSKCDNCAFFGSFGGQFFAYCGNCAEFEYNFERGPGMYVDYTELLPGPNCQSIFETYMEGVALTEIGDMDMNTDEFNAKIPAMLERRRILQEKINMATYSMDELLVEAELIHADMEKNKK